MVTKSAANKDVPHFPEGRAVCDEQRRGFSFAATASIACESGSTSTKF
jgi:hypothetical protein